MRNSDIVSVDVAVRRISLEVADDELARRKAALPKPEPRFERGYGWMFSQHIRRANEGCDFDFLQTDFGAPAGEPAIC